MLQQPLLMTLSWQENKRYLGKNNGFVCFLSLNKQQQVATKSQCFVPTQLLETQQSLTKTQPVILFVGLEQWSAASQARHAIHHPLHLLMTKSAHILSYMKNTDVTCMKHVNVMYSWFTETYNVNIFF